MFETKPPAAHPPAADPGEALPLRAMTWSDLRARLDAARDLHRALARQDPDRMASFDARSAQHIAELADGKRAINPQDSANGKGSGHTTGADAVAGSGSILRT
ncbi:MAG: hypothetical protein N2Z59_07065 [Alteraurantiacibacter sp.]|nr:hypothetical protein [Alteraurantiacibacter sp.]